MRARMNADAHADARDGIDRRAMDALFGHRASGDRALRVANCPSQVRRARARVKDENAMVHAGTRATNAWDLRD